MITAAVREYVLKECSNGDNAFGPGFFDQHLAVVVEYAGRLAEVLGADPEIVELAGRDWLRQRVENNWAALIPPARTIIEKEYRQVAELLRL